jgi:hypothetical protein
MTLILRCRCGSAKLAISSGDEAHHASLVCLDCDRRVRWLNSYQAKAFGRNLPSQQAIESVQETLFEQQEGEL